MNVTALLVDDEINILRNLEKVIPWEQLGIEMVATAQNGIQALEHVEAFHPDLIISDIRMPLMDGIQFLEELRARGETSEVIMLTGYQDFEYARSVMRHGAREYILKPINYEELEQTVGKTAAEIRKRKSELLMEERKWSKVINLVYEKILYDILMDYQSVNSNYVLPDDEWNINDLSYSLMLVDLDDYPQRSRQWTENERKLWNFAVRNVLQEGLQGKGLQYAVLQMREGEWCVLVEREKKAGAVDLEEVHAWASTLQAAVKQNVKLDISIALYPCITKLDGLPNAYKKAQRALYLAINKKMAIITASESAEKQEPPSYTLWKTMEELISGLKQADRTKTDEALKKLGAELKDIAEQSAVRVQQVLHYSVLHLIRELKELDALPGNEEEALWGRLEQSVDWIQLLHVITEAVNGAIQQTSGKKSSEVMMDKAADYVHRNLASDIGVEELADFLGISTSYFSLLFKQHFGETFVEYVTRQRIELAQSMLTMTDKSVAQIGKTVGYAERRYFTKVFLKHSGCTPSEYREQKRPHKT